MKKMRSTMAVCNSSIPEEVVVSEILVRLPASCVVRLRSVCRSWRRLTTEPSFLRAHTARSSSSVGSAVVYQLYDNQRLKKDGETRLVKLDAHGISTFQIRRFPGDSMILRLLASCDGLLCFQTGNGREPMPFHVCNPVTRIWTTVPASARVDAAALDIYGISWYHRYLCGFYFHLPTHKYRLLYFSSNYVNGRCQGAYEVATVGATGESWRTIYEFLATPGVRDLPAKERLDGAETLAEFGRLEPGSVQVNGSLHWLHAVSGAKMGIVAFDTEREKFSRMLAPRDFGQLNRVWPLGFRISKIRGNLCVGWITEESQYVGEEETMELWMLKDYTTQRWVKLHMIQPSRHLFVRTVRPRGGGGVRHGEEEEEEEGELMVNWGMDRFGLYNFKHKTCMSMSITSFDVQPNTDFCAWDLIPYTESLVDPRK